MIQSGTEGEEVRGLLKVVAERVWGWLGGPSDSKVGMGLGTRG